MKIPNELYFIAKTEKTTYGHSLPGDFVPERALRGLAPFKKIRPQKKLEPKNLILSPFLCQILHEKIRQDPMQREKITAVFTHLLEHEFKIFNTRQQMLSLTDILDLIETPDTRSAKKINIDKVKKALSCASAEIQILNSYWFEAIANAEKKLPPKVLGSNDILMLPVDLRQTYIEQERSNPFSPELTGITIEKWDEDTLAFLETIPADIKTIFDVREIPLSKNSIATITAED